MRMFDYRKNHSIIGTTINGYITQLHKEITLLKGTNVVYDKALEMIESFKLKYENMHYISALILKDLLEPDNIEYCMQHGEYPLNCSTLGKEFEEDLKRIIKLEDELRKIAVESWKTDLTNFEDIKNGEDFMVVGHSSFTLPGTKDNSNYKTGQYSKQYLSCSLLSQRELNTFHGEKIVYLVDINNENYIASSCEDAVTTETNSPQFETLKKISENGVDHYIKAGYNHDSSKAVTSISTPQLIEKLSVEREVGKNGELFNYRNLLTNEVILDRTTTKVTGALLISKGCDLLIEEYLYLRKNNVNFKCLNIGLYKEKFGYPSYNEKEYAEFLKKNSSLPNYDIEVLLEYFNDVVIPMNYSSEITNIIKKTLFGNLNYDSLITTNKKTSFEI